MTMPGHDHHDHDHAGHDLGRDHLARSMLLTAQCHGFRRDLAYRWYRITLIAAAIADVVVSGSPGIRRERGGGRNRVPAGDPGVR
jgi:hypothetical protein